MAVVSTEHGNASHDNLRGQTNLSLAQTPNWAFFHLYWCVFIYSMAKMPQMRWGSRSGYDNSVIAFIQRELDPDMDDMIHVHNDNEVHNSVVSI